MKYTLKKKITLPVLAIIVLFTGTAFKSDFFEIAKQIEIFTTLFKEVNMNYVDETNPGELMDSAIKNMLKELDPYTVFMNEQDVEAALINNFSSFKIILSHFLFDKLWSPFFTMINFFFAFGNSFKTFLE